MSHDESLPIQDKQFDGISEDDNPLPNWWKSIAYASIVFAIGYMVLMHTDFLVHIPSPQDRFQAEIHAMRYRQDSIRALRPPFVFAEMTALRQDKDRLAAGRKLFEANCVACHAAGGAGNIGPNLTDDFWLHGGRIDSVAMTIQNGVPSKGMPTWGNQFDDDQIKTLAIFVKSLHGTHPANPKAPQGVLDTL
jgi:cytochrome c oxidase cbb3-type subunit 3